MSIKPDIEFLKTRNIMTFFTPAGHALPGNEKAAHIIEARFANISDEMIEWLKSHNVTIQYHATRIEASADVRVGKFTSTVSGLHQYNEEAAIKELMRRTKYSQKCIDRNRENLEEFIQSEDSWDIPIENDEY